MIDLSDSRLADLALWEEGVCLTCGAESEPLEDLTRLHECEECCAQDVWPAVLLQRMQQVWEDAEVAE